MGKDKNWMGIGDKVYVIFGTGIDDLSGVIVDTHMEEGMAMQVYSIKDAGDNIHQVMHYCLMTREN